MVENDDIQRAPGRTSPCCICMAWAWSCSYIKKGFMWRNEEGPCWIPWCFRVSGPGWIETSPIHYCPFCGVNLDRPEE